MNVIRFPYPKGSGAFNVSNIVQFSGRPSVHVTKVTIPLGRGALNVSTYCTVSGRW